ncbi:hydrogen peroxide-inducible genes activator [Hyphobacterium sp.]|uniref:hydrogen peroxide-inducible genes activator n=1 Tax=Hyphobacterium sp. TaxID=2004662 RepID=UPI003BAC1B5A
MAQPTLKQLSALVAIADTGLFKTAAEKLYISQPALSEQISQLEYRLGAVLLERDRRGARLTPVGREVAARARTIQQSVAELGDVVRSGLANLGGLIRLGALPTLGPYLMPYIVPVLHERYPDLRLYVREAWADALTRDVMAGEFDCALTVLPGGAGGLHNEPLFEEALFLGIARGDPLTKRKSIDSRALAGRNFLTLEEGNRLTDQVKALARAAGGTLLDDYQGTSLDGLRQMVGMGMGVSVFPQFYVRSEIGNDQAVEARPLKIAGAQRPVSLIWRAGSPRAKDFATLGDIIAETASNLIGGE